MIANWGLVCQKLVSRAGTCDYITWYLMVIITCPCQWYLFLEHKYSTDNCPTYTSYYTMPHHDYNLLCIPLSTVHINHTLKVSLSWGKKILENHCSVHQIDGLVQDCSICIANTVEILSPLLMHWRYCSLALKPSIWYVISILYWKSLCTSRY